MGIKLKSIKGTKFGAAVNAALGIKPTEPKGERLPVEGASFPSWASPFPIKEVVRHVIKVEPMGKPRMTIGDRVKRDGAHRPCVQAFWDYKKKIQDAVGDVPVVPHRVDVVFYISCPPSWSVKKMSAHVGSVHRSRPDRDNIDKGVLDSLFLEDGGVADGFIAKRWCLPGMERVELYLVYYDIAL